MVWDSYTLLLTSTIPVFKLQTMVVSTVNYRSHTGATTKHILQFLVLQKNNITKGHCCRGHHEPVFMFIFPENTSIEPLGLRTEGLSRHTRISKAILNVWISHHHVVRWFYRSLNPMLGIMTNMRKNSFRFHIKSIMSYYRCCEYHGSQVISDDTQIATKELYQSYPNKNSGSILDELPYHIMLKQCHKPNSTKSSISSAPPTQQKTSQLVANALIHVPYHASFYPINPLGLSATKMLPQRAKDMMARWSWCQNHSSHRCCPMSRYQSPKQHQFPPMQHPRNRHIMFLVSVNVYISHKIDIV